MQIQINEERVLKRLTEMIRIDSVSFHEAPMTDYLEKYFTDLGYEVYRDQAGQACGCGEAGNLIIHIGGTMPGEAVCLNAHQDTVEPGWGIEPVYDPATRTLTSKGDTILAADDKSGIAMIMELLDVLQENQAEHRDLWLLFTICEENGMYGAKNLDTARLPVKNICALDGAGTLGRMGRSGAGKDSLKITFRGRTAHGGIEPEKGINAIAVCADAISRIKFGRLGPQTTSNIGHIEGGGATNIVTDEVWFTCEVRSHTQAEIDAEVQHIMDTCRATAEAWGASCEIELDHFCPPYKPDPDSFLFTTMQKCYAAEGIEVGFFTSNGSGDNNIFSGLGYHCGGISTGMNAVHTTGEYLLMEDFEKAFRVIYRMLTGRY